MKSRYRTQNTTSEENQNTQYNEQEEKMKENCEVIVASELDLILPFQNDSLKCIAACFSNSEPVIKSMSALAWLKSNETASLQILGKSLGEEVVLSFTLFFFFKKVLSWCHSNAEKEWKSVINLIYKSVIVKKKKKIF